MKFVSGNTEKETVELETLLSEDYEGREIRINGAVHTIRDMGDVAFVVLRKRGGLVQTVWEQGVTDYDLKLLKEAATVEVLGTVTKEDRAPNGFEIRLKKVTVLSEPVEPMPISISKWNCKSFSGLLVRSGLYGNPFAENWCQRC